ncbi:MAG: copper resistance protein CopC [Chloroflexi bacterium]|nr:copper resistance protein CopC [Chloroflexota bacterium]
MIPRPVVVRSILRALPAALVALILLGLPARSVSAHALYDHSQPPSGAKIETPGQIQVWFTEDIEPNFSGLEVLDANRNRVDRGDSYPAPGEKNSLIVSVPDVPDGVYTISWRVLSSIDGHATKGVFPLMVGEVGLGDALSETPAFVPGPLDVTARWFSYAGALALAGGFIFLLVVARPTFARQAGPEMASLAVSFERLFVRRARLAALLLLASTLVGLVSQAANAADVPVLQAIGQPVAQLLGTRLGLLWQLRLALAIVLLLLLAWARGRALTWSGLVASAGVLVAISMNSHAAAIPSGAWLAVPADWVHQVAAAAWVGGLFTFALLLHVAGPTLEQPSSAALVARLIPRFSALAIVSVVILIVTGLFQSRLQVKTPPALETLYGVALLVKIALVLPLVGLGAANLLVVRPRLAAALRTRGQPLIESTAVLIRRFRLAVLAEVGLAVLVLMATALLTSSEPARETYARQPRPIELRGLADNVAVDLRIAPGRPGPNEVVVRLDGPIAPPNEVQRVSLRVTSLDEDLGASTVVLPQRPDGSYGAVSTNITTDGAWQIEAIVRRRGLEDARIGFRTTVVNPDTAGQPPSLEFLPNPATIPPRQLLAMAFMALGLALAFWISRAGGVRRHERTGLYAASFAVALIGGVLYSRAVTANAVPADLRTMRNPFPPDSASIAAGKVVYGQNCVSCHGEAGRGDGPLAATLRPRPADFRVHMAAGHTDGELFAWISRGVPGTSMPAFEGQLSEADRWNTINYIRGFAPPSP